MDPFLYRWALEQLARGDLASQRLVDRVLRAGKRHCGDERYASFTATEATALVSRLTADGLLDDRRYAEARLRQMVSRKAGLRAIRGKMLTRQLERTVVDAVLEDFKRAGNPQDFTRIIALTRERRKKLEAKYAGDRQAREKIKRGLYGFLALKGYPADDIGKILRATDS